jgi:predicted methyltransferase|tara:strand:+ start:115 stop:957 length:843 start_codon:yes stop_codon:yes gene_type:complete
MKQNTKTTVLASLLAIAFSLLSLNANAVSSSESVVGPLIDNAIASDHRSAKNKARDSQRHPKETLMFFGFKPGMKVLEILPGGGWYTEILAPALKDYGQLTVASFGADNPSDYMRNVHNRYVANLEANPEVYGQVKTEVFEEEGYLTKVASDSQDMILTFRNSHNWIRFGGIEQAYKSFSRVLKKGGVLGVVQHRAAPDADVKQTAEQGYVPEAYLIQLAESMGFKLVAQSEINANAKDTKDHSKGVWSLPPSFREKDNNREKYAAIGETDRMTLRFVKL